MFERLFLTLPKVSYDLSGTVHLTKFGFISEPGAREFVLVQTGQKHFLKIGGRAPQTPGVLAPIPEMDFRTLWPTSRKRQIKCTAQKLKGSQNPVQLEHWNKPGDGLTLLRARFSRLEDYRSFEVPEDFGPEVTWDTRFDPDSLAAGELNPRDADWEQIQAENFAVGVIPFLPKAGGYDLVTVSSRKSDRQIFPKGQPESGMTHGEVALMEAEEEAGLHGTLTGHPVLLKLGRRGEDVNLLLFPMRVTELLPLWREAGQRKRILVDKTDLGRFAGNSLIIAGNRVIHDLYG